MPTFRLSPDDILAKASGRLDDHAFWYGFAGSHTVGYMDSFSGWQGLVSLLMRQHGDCTTAVLTNGQAGERVLSAVAGKLKQCQTDYDRADDDIAVRFDGLFANLGQDAQYRAGGSLGTPGPQVSFPPGAPHLRRATPMEGIPEGVLHLITLGGDFISPSFYLLGLVELLIGLDPIDWVAKAVVGDYRVISEVGDAILPLSEFTAQQADLMATDAGIMFNCWQGEAASAATPYFRGLLAMVGGQSGPLASMGELYIQFAWSAFLLAEALVSALCTLLDAVLMLGIDAIALALGISTGPGEVGVAGVLALWNTVVTMHGNTVAVCFGLVGLIAGATGAFETVSLANFKEA